VADAGGSHLLASDTADEYRRWVAAGAERVAARVVAASGPFTGVTAPELEPVVGAIDLDAPLGDSGAALDELDRVYLRDAVYFHHSRYLAHLNCSIVIPALLGEVVLSGVNSSLDTWDQSAGGMLIERRLIDWTARRIGFGADADGVFTSGGTQSNVQGLLSARDEAVRRVDGLIPMAVVAIAGTTDFGSIDPLPAISGLCASAGVWLHVDAAYRCGLLVSAHRRHLLAGIEYADSMTVDYHKSFFQPVSSSALIVRDRRMLDHVTYHADYLNPATSASQRIPNQVDKSLQTTRRFDALKLWLRPSPSSPTSG
jgi:L-2,4-diaminobutyrate decarboxylase